MRIFGVLSIVLLALGVGFLITGVLQPDFCFPVYLPPLVEVPQNGETSCVVKVANRSFSELTLLAATASCTCTTLPDFPVKIAPGEIHDLRINITSKSRKAGEASSVRLRLMGVCNDSNIDLTSEIPFTVVEFAESGEEES